MKESSAKTIWKNATIKVSVDEEYSGRGMYGETTHAIHTDSVLGLFQDLAEVALENLKADHESGVIAILEAMADMKRWDSSGRGVVIY